MRLTLFHVSITQGEPQKLEHEDMRWIFPADIPQYVFCPADEAIFTETARVCREHHAVEHARMRARGSTWPASL